MLKFSFEKSKIFPGTYRDYWVYVPKQYDPAKPACVYVNQDGVGYQAPVVFDNLIHKKEIPVLIGVFIMHGRVKAADTNALDRFNRSYEYDGLGGDYAKFLLDELFPFIEATHAVKLSKNGTDRAIGRVALVLSIVAILGVAITGWLALRSGSAAPPEAIIVRCPPSCRWTAANNTRRRAGGSLSDVSHNA